MLDTIIEEIHVIQFEASIYISFAGPALLLAAIGIHGVMSLLVS